MKSIHIENSEYLTMFFLTKSTSNEDKTWSEDIVNCCKFPFDKRDDYESFCADSI